MMPQLRAAARSRQCFDDCGARAGVSYEWRPFKGSTGAANSGVIDSVRAADLVICLPATAGHGERA